MKFFLAVLALAGTLTAAQAGKIRTQAYWGGGDLPWSCEMVRQWAPVARLMSAKMQSDLARKNGITPKMMRQARKCLR